MARAGGPGGAEGESGARWLLAGRGGGLAEPCWPGVQSPRAGHAGEGLVYFLVFFFFLATSKIPCKSGAVQMYFQRLIGTVGWEQAL